VSVKESSVASTYILREDGVQFFFYKHISFSLAVERSKTKTRFLLLGVALFMPVAIGTVQPWGVRYEFPSLS
jgi:hypothetical protein